MKRIITILALLVIMACSTYTDSIQGKWELSEIRDGKGEMVYEACKGGKCDVVELSFESKGDILTVTAHDLKGKEMTASYRIKEDGRLVNINKDKPNMYILDIKSNKVALIDRMYEKGGGFYERILVFKKVPNKLDTNKMIVSDTLGIHIVDKDSINNVK